MLTSVATSWAVPLRIAPPVPVYGPSVPSRITTKSMSGSPASGLRTPGYHRLGQHFAGGVESPGPQVVIGLFDTRQHRVENLDRFGDYLRPDPVAGNHCQFHERSTTSSLLAATADPISERTPAGTSRSSRSRIVAPGPSVSSDS